MKNADSTISLFELLDKLRKAKIHFSLSSHREEAIMVEIATPGQRWEVEFFRDGTVEIEKFHSNGVISDQTELKTLFSRFSK